MSLQIEVMASSAHGGASHWAGAFLAEGMPAVGAAIRKIEVDLLVRNEPRAVRARAIDAPFSEAEEQAWLEALALEGAITPDHPEWGRFHDQERAKGNRLTFRRQAARVDVRVVSEVSDLDVFREDLGPYAVEPVAFSQVAHEIVGALGALERRLKKADDFDYAAFTAHLAQRLDGLPATAAELEEVIRRLWERRREQWIALSEWDLLDVDWSLYAPNARELLDDPLFWDPADDAGPHGNDSGFDLLADYLEQRPVDALAFVNAFVVDGGYESLAALAEDDPYEYDDVVIAGAFAEIKGTGRLGAELRDLALQVVERRAADDPNPSWELLRSALG